MLFKYQDTFHPVNSTEVVSHTIPTPVCPGKPWEWTPAQLHIVLESDLIKQRKMFCLADSYLIPLNLWLRDIKSSAMIRHWPGS